MTKKYIIDRSKWRCGGDGFSAKGKGVTKLLNSDGYMCCLGQTSRQEGISDSDLLNRNNPSCVGKDVGPFATYCSKFNDYESTLLARDAIRINDNTEILNEERERRLIELFSRHDLELEFIN